MSRKPLPTGRPPAQSVVEAPVGPDSSYIRSIRYVCDKVLFRSDGIVGSLRGPFIVEVKLTDLGLQDFHPGIRSAVDDVRCVYTTGPLSASLNQFPGLGPGWYLFVHKNNADVLRVSINWYQQGTGDTARGWYRDVASPDTGQCPLTLAYRRWFFHIATARAPDFRPVFEPPQWGPWEDLIRRHLANSGS